MKKQFNTGALALILGLTLAITGSAFKAPVEGDLHAKINGVWVDIDDEDVEGVDYTCEETGMCTARFDLGSGAPSDENYLPGTLESGTYIP